jgi:hypothetical protein
MQDFVYIRICFAFRTHIVVSCTSDMTGASMKTRVMHTVHTMLQQSGQSVPAKHLSISKNSLEVYDVSHWPESFNSLLLHDFPHIVICIDTSSASISGFVVTLRWNESTNISEWVSVLVHVLVMGVLLTVMINLCVVQLKHVPVDELDRIRSLYAGSNNATMHEFGVYGPSSQLTDELRSVMSHNEVR